MGQNVSRSAYYTCWIIRLPSSLPKRKRGQVLQSKHEGRSSRFPLVIDLAARSCRYPTSLAASDAARGHRLPGAFLASGRSPRFLGRALGTAIVLGPAV